MNLYEADMDDLDSSDIGDSHKSYLKEKKTSKYDPGIQSNLSSLRKAFYQMGYLVTATFFLSSIFTFVSRRELIFPKRSGP